MNVTMNIGINVEGVYVPVVTPFRADESIDDDAFGAVIEYLIEAGVDGVVVGGTTGEYYALSPDERRAQLELAAKIVAGRAQLVAGCNSGATKDVVDYAKHARGHGYDAIMLSPPPSSLPTQHELAAHVTAAAREGGLPVVLYNYPDRFGVEFGLEAMDLLADMPEIIAIKESSYDFSRFLTINDRYRGRIHVMCGSDDQAFDYMAWGVRSWLAGPGNVLPRQHVEFTESMLRGELDLARRQFAALLPWLQHMDLGKYIPKVKASLEHLGVDVGVVRRPLTGLTGAEHADLIDVLDRSIVAFDEATNG